MRGDLAETIWEEATINPQANGNDPRAICRTLGYFCRFPEPYRAWFERAVLRLYRDVLDHARDSRTRFL